MKLLLSLFLLSHLIFAHDVPVINMAMVPGLDNIILEKNGNLFKQFLEKETGLNIHLFIPQSFVAVVEAMGTKRVDFALLNTYGYLLAHKRYGAKVRLIGTFHSRKEYFGQIITRVDGPKTLKDLNGKSFAFVDPASTSGFILAKKALDDEHVVLKSSLFTGKHDAVVSMVYQGRVDAGATYHTLPLNGEPQDARTLVKTQFPDVLSKVKILKVTGPIPADPIVFGAHVSLEIENKIVNALKKFIKTKEGKDAFLETYKLDGVVDATDKDWDSFRDILKQIGQEIK